MQTERYFAQNMKSTQKSVCEYALYNSVMRNFPSNAQLLFDKIIFKNVVYFLCLLHVFNALQTTFDHGRKRNEFCPYCSQCLLKDFRNAPF